MKNKLLLFSLVLVLFSCKKDPVEPPTTDPVDPVVTTQAPTNITTTDATFNGTLVSIGSDNVIERGFCWSLNSNPTVGDNNVWVDGSGTGTFYKEVEYEFEANTTYHVRAYVQTEYSEIFYGNDISFTTKDIFDATTNQVLDIYSKGAYFKGTIISYDMFEDEINNKGICVSTSPNPTINSSIKNTITDGDIGDFTIYVSGMQTNTTYYARAFGYNTTSKVYYGNELTFKTVGYLGAGGGYVFFDKNYTSDGWRYLEAGPVDIDYNNVQYSTVWGCSGTLVGGTGQGIGWGAYNTQQITNDCSAANCAARICADYSVNGLSDWFLGSVSEMEALDASTSTYLNWGNEEHQAYWTSTEVSTTQAGVYNMYYHFAPGFGISKSLANIYSVRPLRRF